MHTPIPFFLSVGVGVSVVVPPIVNSGAFFGGCERCFGFLWENIWLCTNSAHNQFYGFIWWGCVLGSSGNLNERVLATAAGVCLQGVACLAWVRPAVLCKWLPVGCPSWVLVLVDGAGVPSVLLSVLSLLPHLLRLFFVGWVFPFSPCNPFFPFSLLLSCIIYIILYIRKIIIYNLFFTFGLFLILSIRNLNYNSQCYILVLLNKNSILVIFNY